MPRTNPEARERLVATAADMLRRRCLNATSIRELAKAANAPLGSTYHYFPGGKKQVVIEAVQYAGNKTSRMLDKALEKSPAQGLDALLNLWRNVILETDFKAGCPIIAVAMEDATNEDVQAAQEEAAKIFSRWRRLMRESFIENGADPKLASRLATMVIASAEGAIAMCRVLRDIEPFEEITEQLHELLNEALSSQ